MSTNVGPSRWWYVAGVILWLGACFTPAVTLSRGMQEKVSGLQRAVFPGQHQFDFAPGKYTAFYESRSAIGGALYATGASLSGLSCGLTRDDGSAVKLKSPTAASSYSLGGYAGASIFQFEVATKGAYRMDCAYDGDKGQRIVISAGSGLMSSLVAPIIVAGLISLLGLGTIIVVRVKRKRALRALLGQGNELHAHAMVKS
ncbi:MAG: hypothetical protein IPL40_14815 [Proteobacteria bacterium]|nr:hypothetical protein [Pseudomonadota bacterium]